jgi:hypothetical protein
MIDVAFLSWSVFGVFCLRVTIANIVITRSIDIIAVAGNSGMVCVGEGVEVDSLYVFFIFVFCCVLCGGVGGCVREGVELEVSCSR